MKAHMTNQFEVLKQQNFNLDLFYSVSFRRNEIKLQGELSGETRKYCEGLGFEFTLEESNWLQGTMRIESWTFGKEQSVITNVQVVLTF